MSHHEGKGGHGGYGVPAYPGGPGLNQTARVFGQGALMGATIGAMIGAARSYDANKPMTPQASDVTRSAVREASRLGIAAGLGATASSLVPAGDTVRLLTMITVGAAVLSVTAEGKEAESENAEKA